MKKGSKMVIYFEIYSLFRWSNSWKKEKCWHWVIWRF